MAKKKSLLVLGAGPDQVYPIKKAKLMGLEVVCVDKNKESPGFEFADYSASISNRDIDSLIDFCHRHNKNNNRINGILVMGSDIPQIQARLAEELNLTGPSMTTALLTTNKYLMKKKLLDSKINVPWFSLIKNEDHLQELLNNRANNMFVIKPTDLSGAKGVFLIDKRKANNIGELYLRAKELSFSSEVQLEEYIKGPQISTESIIINGKAYTPGFVDRNYEMLQTFYPNIIENGGNHPSFLSSKIKRDILDLVEKSASVLGIHNGVAKGDIVLSESGTPMIIEMASRLSGGDMSESLVPLGCGVDIVKVAIKLALNESIDLKELEEKHKVFVANRYFFSKTGVINSIQGLEKVKNFSWLEKIQLFKNIGDNITETINHSSRLGVFVVSANNKELLEERIKTIYNTIKIEIK